MSEKLTSIQRVAMDREPVGLFEYMTSIHNNIARRAFEIFQDEGRILGNDLQHWLKAEAEVLHPVSVDMFETDDMLTIEAELPGFSATDLKVTLEPERLVIRGKREYPKVEKKIKKVHEELRTDEVLRVIGLPMEVLPGKSEATLKNGILEVKMPKVASHAVTPLEVKAA